MTRLLRFLWTGSWHEHTWAILAKGPIKGDGTATIGTYYELQCSGCGDVTARSLVT